MIGEAASFFGVDRAKLPRWDRSIDSSWKAVIKELRWSVKSVKALHVWHRTRRTDPASARLHMHRAMRAALIAERARERSAINLLAAGQPGTFEPGEERKVRHAAFQVIRSANKAGERLDLLWEKLQQAFAVLSPAGDGRPHVVRRRFARRVLRDRLRSAAERILARIKRRQRSRAAAPEDAPRRVSQGRAPPFPAAASL